MLLHVDSVQNDQEIFISHSLLADIFRTKEHLRNKMSSGE